MFLLLFLLPCLSTLRPGSGVGANTKVRPSEQRKVQDELEMPSLPPQSRVVSQGGRTQSEACGCGTPRGAAPAPSMDPLWAVLSLVPKEEGLPFLFAYDVTDIVRKQVNY